MKNRFASLTVNRKRYIIIAVVIIALLALEQLLEYNIEKQPEYQEIITANPFNTLPPTEYLGTYLATVSLGGFKPLLVDYLWIKQTKLQDDKQFEQIRLLLDIIAYLQPRFVEVWAFNAYNMTYNISFQGQTAEDKWRWIESGIDYIQEGMKHNPKEPTLIQWLAFFYYHRIPQDEYFMRKVEEKEGKDTYEIAADWFQKTMDLCEKQKMPETANTFRSLYASSHFLHCFNLVEKNRFDDAIKELEYLIDYNNTSNQAEEIRLSNLIRINPTREQGLMNLIRNNKAETSAEINRLKDLIDVFKYEEKIGQINITDADFLTKNSLILAQYKNLYNKHIGYDFRPIEKHILSALTRYVKNSFLLIDRGQYDKALEQMGILVDEANKMMPKLDKYPGYMYYSSLLTRYKQLQELVNNECSLRKQGIINPAQRDQRMIDFRTKYEQYLRKYSSHGATANEKERFDSLFPK